MKTQDAYEKLGLTGTEDYHAVKRAWRSFVMAEHPDRGGDVEKFLDVKSAYDLLTKRLRHRTCPTCEGSGKVEVTVGWSTTYKRCPTCKGKKEK